MFRTLRGRLTALATGITLVVSLLVCVTLYLGIRHSLYGEVDAFLAGEVAEFRAILADAASDLDDVRQRIQAELGSRQRGDLSFRLLNEDGNVLLTSHEHHALPDHWPLPAQRPPGLLYRTEVGNGVAAQTRTCSQWVAGPDGSMRIVQATYLLDQVQASLWRFIRICVLALFGATIMATIGGRVLATRGLRPVGRMVAAARRISARDLTERLARTGAGDELDHLAEAFNNMLGRLETQVAQLRQFTADAAHELRTPLAALRGNAEVALSQERSASELRAVLVDSIENYDRLARIADDLLLLARADVGQDFFARKPLALENAVADVVDLFTPTAEDHGVALQIADIEPVQVNGDDGRLRQMIGNLIDNAIKFTPPGGQITVSLTVSDRVAELAVRDSGIGIASQDLALVFDRFFRADAARSAGGAGLGLSICRTIVQAHGGTIELSSAPGDGTTAIARIPLGR